MALYAICFERQNYSSRYGWDRYEFAKTRRGALSAIRRLVRSYGSSGGTIIARYYQDGLYTGPDCRAIPPGTWVVRLEWPCEETATPGYQRAAQWTDAAIGRTGSRIYRLEPVGKMPGVRRLAAYSRTD